MEKRTCGRKSRVLSLEYNIEGVSLTDGDSGDEENDDKSGT